MGALQNGTDGFGKVLYYATPIMLTGLSVAFAFKTGLFNIGAAGQFMIGAYAGVYVGVKFTSLGSAHWVVALLAATLVGALWAAIPGILKAYCNINEVISSIMLNYTGMYLVNYLIKSDSALYNTLKNESNPVAETAVIPKFGLDKIFSPSTGVGGGFLIAILAVIIIYVLLQKTTFGYELKAVGFNREASKYAGINEKRGIIISMLIAGALAGLAGGILYLGGSGKYMEVVDVLAAEGFNGIPVALLGLSNPIGVAFAAIFIAYIGQGGFYLQSLTFAPEIIDIIIAVIIYFSAFALILQNMITSYTKKRRNKKEVQQQLPGKPAEQTIEVPVDELEVEENEEEGDDR